MKFASCFHPRVIKNQYTDEKLVVSCRKCPACIEMKNLEMIMRLRYEAMQNKYVLFFTLTYSEKYCPVVKIYDGFDSRFIELARVRLGDSSCYLESPLSNDIDLNVLSHDMSFNDFDNDFLKNKSFLRVFFKQDISQFIKKVQNYFYYHYGEKIRYFCTSELGAKRLRPHYHGLFFTNRQEIAKELYKVLCASWSFGRIDASFAKSAALGYVAKYLNGSSNYPKIYDVKEFKPFTLYSKRPSIGVVEIGSKEFQKILFDETRKIELVENTHFVDSSYWRSLENNCFPKCREFSSLSRNGRMSKYLVALSLYKQVKNFPEISFSSVFRSYVSAFIDYDNDYQLSRVYRDFRTSFHFLRVCETYHLDCYAYLDLIDDYYYKKSMFLLKDFYSFQEYICNNFPHQVKYLVNLYPLMFSELCTASDFLQARQRYLFNYFGIDYSKFVDCNGVFMHELFRAEYDFTYSKFYSSWRNDVIKRDYDNNKTKILNDSLNLLND